MHRFLMFALPLVLLLALLTGDRIASAGIAPSVTLAIDGDGVGPVYVPAGSTATATIGVFGAPGRVYVVGCTSSPCSMANAFSINSPVVNGVPAGGSTTITFTPLAAYPFYAAILEPQTGRYYSNTIQVTSVAPSPAPSPSPVNSPPVAVADDFVTNFNTPLNVPAPGVLFNDTDADGDTLTAELVTSTTNGMLTFTFNGGFVYVPNSGYSGPDSFTYAADDGAGIGNVTTVSITVLPPPSPSPSSSPSESASASTSPSASESASTSPSASPSISPSPSASASISPSPSESPSATASASVSASASASASPVAGIPAPDAVVIEAFIEQDDARIGETVYTDEETVGTTATGDRRPATEGELTFVVVDSATNTILDEDSTDADGIVVLDAQTGAPFFIYEIAEPDDAFYGSPDYLLVGDETLDLEVTRFVAVQPASASPVASGSASAVASASAGPSATTAPSAAVSDDGTTMPSAAPATGTGANTLPNTGIGTTPRTAGPGSLLWLALLGTALALMGAAGLGVRRR